MSTLLIAVASFAGFIIAYHTYGRWLARKIFGLNDNSPVPSQQLRDNVDFIPTKKEVIFGHHFTSIAGTGPIVGPAIAVFWGWLPALLWVVFGSIFIGAVHDFGALVISLRNRGQTVGDVAGRLISKRAKALFLLILFFALTIVLAIFGLVIANIFKMYPESVLSVWVAMPIAVGVGFWVYRRGGGLLVPSILALIVLYASVYIGVYHLRISLPVENPAVVWTLVLMAYCFVAAILPVWILLQPRDFINSHQLVVALVLLVVGVLIAGATGQADIVSSAPAVAQAPIGAPPIWPFLFITIACGACSGFHCLVSSGTSSKQVARESDAQYVAYGSMLLEGALAVLVIIACCAGVGMGQYKRTNSHAYVAVIDDATGEQVKGRAAWTKRYDSSSKWSDFGLAHKVGAFVDGGANFLTALRIPIELGIGIIAVLVACFAATTLDTATRLQRYVIQELAEIVHVPALKDKYAATGLAVVLACSVAMIPGGAGKPAGTGGLILWPLFGATNQLLAGLAFMVTVFYLWRRNKPVWFAAIPMVVMIIMPAWALWWQMFNADSGWAYQATLRGRLLLSFGLVISALQAWMVVEALALFPRVKGVMEEALPPIEQDPRFQAAKGQT